MTTNQNQGSQRGGSSAQHAAAGRQSHKNDTKSGSSSSSTGNKSGSSNAGSSNKNR